MDAKILARRKQDFREGKIIRAIATDVWSTGVDFPALAVVCRLDGRTNRIRSAQGPGRVTRRSDATGKDVGIVIDCWDEFDSRLLNRSRLRAREYRKLGWSVETPTHGNQRSLFR
jgi:superfamily II DNA or RNA helicase